MRRLTTVVILLSVIFISCQKEISPADVINPILADTSFLLKKFVVLDTTQAASNDTVSVLNYFYDNLNRCTQIIVNDYQNNSTGYTYNYYNGADIVIASRRLINQVSTDSVVEFFTYASNGQMLSDSVLEYPAGGGGLTVSVYRYQPVNNLFVSAITSNGQPFIVGKYLVTKDNAGNTIAEKDSSFNYNAGTYSYNDNIDIVSSYDANPCPFFNLYPKRVVELEYELVAVDDIPLFGFLQKNNVKTKQSTTLPITSGLGDSNETFQYIYKSNNYPLSVIYRDLLLGSVYKGIYYY